jgi:hypothetical protein
MEISLPKSGHVSLDWGKREKAYARCSLQNLALLKMIRETSPL